MKLKSVLELVDRPTKCENWSVTANDGYDIISYDFDALFTIPLFSTTNLEQTSCSQHTVSMYTVFWILEPA